MKVLLLFLCSFSAYGAISVNSVWELRTTGADTNGAGYVTGSSGTDYSQNDNKNAAACTNCGSSTANLSTTDAVASGIGTITSITAAFSSAIVGNIIYLQGGTGSLAAGWYQVITFTNASTIVVDRNVATGTGITMNIGGALLTLSQLLTNMASFNTGYVKSGTYTQTTAITLTTNCLGTSSTAQNLCSVNGYGSTRGDGGARPLITTATNSTTLIQLNGAAGWVWNHLSFSNTAGTPSAGFNATGASYYQTFQDSVFNGFTVAILGNWNVQETIRRLVIISCEIKGSTGNTASVYNTDGATIIGSYIHGNSAGAGWGRPENSGFTGPMIARYTTFASNGNGSGFAGITISAGGAGTSNYILDVDHCNFYNQTGSGILLGDTTIAFLLQNSIFDGNSRYGVEATTSNSNDPPYAALNQTNFYFNNTLGARLVFPAGTGDVTGTADPFVLPGSANFALNNTTGGGKAAKGVGSPGVTGFTGTGYADIGALQSQASAGGGQTAYTSAQ